MDTNIKDMSAKNQNLKLTCIVTGTSRNTNTGYLEKKADAAGSLETFISNYISRTPAKLLRQGLSVEEVREQLSVDTEWSTENPVTSEQVELALSFNGKRDRRKVVEYA